MKNTRKIFAIIMAVIMCITMMTVTASAADNVSDYGLWVGGVAVTDDNADDILGDGTASYNAEENILTLNGVNITESYNPVSFATFGIYTEGDLNIELAEGSQNEITVPENEMSYGICVEGALYISGNGVLNVTAGSYSGEYADSVGIFADTGLRIEQAYVSATGGDVTVTEGTAYSEGVLTYGNVIVDFGGSLVAIGGDASSENGVAFSDGICLFGDGENYYSVSVYNGYLKACGGNTTGFHHAMTTGLYLDDAGFCVYENSATVIVEAGDATVTSTDENDDPQAISVGVNSYGGDVEIHAGNVEITAGKCTGLRPFVFGIATDATEKYDGSFSGGYVNVYCDEITLNPYGLGLLGTIVNISAPDGIAIFAQMGVNIQDTLTISEPENAEIGEGDDAFENTAWTVLNAESTPAENVTIEPLIYNVYISGLSYDMVAEVPAGKSLNEFYCEVFGVDDFSETLNTEKEGYTFGGFYTDEACTDGNEFDFDTPITEDVTIYAKWTKVADDTQQGGNSGGTTGGTTTGGTTTGGTITDNPDIPKTDATESTVWFAGLSLSAMNLVAYIALNRKKKYTK